MMRTAKILVVEDEMHIRRLLNVALVRSGYRVVEVDSGRALERVLDIDKPDLVLLDLGLPDRDGLELISLLKARSGAGIVVVTARDDTSEKIAALDLGADDYVTKPFDTEELLARIRAALRRRVPGPGGQPVRSGDIVIDFEERVVRRAGIAVHLTPKEYAVLEELARAAGRVVTHRQLLTAAWGDAYVDRSEYLRVAMRSLRQKLEGAGGPPAILLNEPGIGYRFRIVDGDPAKPA